MADPFFCSRIILFRRVGCVLATLCLLLVYRRVFFPAFFFRPSCARHCYEMPQVCIFTFVLHGHQTESIIVAFYERSRMWSHYHRRERSCVTYKIFFRIFNWMRALSFVSYTLLSPIVRAFHFIKRFGVVVDIFFLILFFFCLLAGQSVMSSGVLCVPIAQYWCSMFVLDYVFISHYFFI